MSSASSSSAAPPVVRKRVNASLAALIQATAGAGGGVWSMFMLFPLDTLKTLIQAGKTKSPNMMAALREVLQSADGVITLYRGLGAKALETASKNFLYFYAYEVLVKLVQARNMEMTTLVNLVVGYWAGIANMLCIMPLEVISTRLQVKKGSFRQAVEEIVAEDGVSGLYAGLKFNILLCLNPAIVNTVFDILKGKILDTASRTNKYLTPIEAFVLGAFSKCVATVLTYPLVRIKTLLQTGGGGEEASKGNKPGAEQGAGAGGGGSSKVAAAAERSGVGRSPSPTSGKSAAAVEKPRSIFSPGEEGFLTFYFRGLGPSLIKTALQAALMYMAKEKIALVTKVLIKSTVHFLRPNTRRSKIKVLGGKPLV